MLQKIFIYSTILIFVTRIYFFQFLFGPTYMGWLETSVYFVAIPIIFFSFHNNGTDVVIYYIGFMLLGFLFHFFLNENEKYPIKDSFQWIFLAVTILASRKYHTPIILLYLLMSFFIVHCLIAFYENINQVHLFNYVFVEDFEIYSGVDFRAFGLMQHPLQSSNVTLIILSFILINKDLNRVIKLFLLILGSLAIICFNSRIATIIWIILLLYRLMLFNIKPIYVLFLGIFIYIFLLTDILSFIIQNGQIFGRLAEKDNLTDDSSLTRYLSFLYFWNAGWNFQDILLGGRVIYLPGTKLSLENGILLNIAWWGWIVGTAKVILELIISYLCLKKYSYREKWILMIACWGTAFANNNSFQSFVFTFFIISFLSFNSLGLIQNKISGNTIKYL